MPHADNEVTFMGHYNRNNPRLYRHLANSTNAPDKKGCPQFTQSFRTNPEGHFSIIRTLVETLNLNDTGHPGINVFPGILPYNDLLQIQGIIAAFCERYIILPGDSDIPKICYTIYYSSG
jgi:hypothetical protein